MCARANAESSPLPSREGEQPSPSLPGREGLRNGPRRRTWLNLALAVGLLALALATRWTALGTFSWPDEQTWLERSAAFVTALERGDLEGTYLSDHPGVMPMWGFGTALYLRARLTGDRAALDALAAKEYAGDYPAQLATAAIFTVLCTSLAVVVAYGLLIPLLGRAGAALAGLLLALDPFFLTQSRVVHVDAILTSFMLISALSLLVYLKHPERRRYLFLSAFAGGLALLTKTPALFLSPLVALVLGIQWLLRRLGRESWGRLGQVAGAFGLWLVGVWVTFVALWPATWSDPLFFVWRLYMASRWGVLVSHGTNFFLGRVVEDPGPLFYLVVLPFRLSPWVLLALPVGLILAVVAWRRREDVRLPVVSVAFILFFTVMVSLAAKKGDRYLLPVFPMTAILAAWTAMALLDRLAKGRRAWRSGYAGVVAVVLLTSVLWLRLAPHYGAYFNPLLGGGPVAERTYAFGQGEGLELAASYLNEKEDGGELLAVTFYPPQFRYYFRGEATSLRRGDWDRTWLFADYVVFYVSQVQRQLPTEGLVAFFEGQVPERTIRLGGVDFAQVYRSPLLLSGEAPGVEEAPAGWDLGEKLALRGYVLSSGRVQAGEVLYATLSWAPVVQLGQDYHFELLLVDEQGQPLWQQAGAPFEGYFPTSWWPPGRTKAVRYEIPLPRDLAPGTYRLLARAWEPGSDQGLAPHGPTVAGWPEHLALGAVVVQTAP